MQHLTPTTALIACVLGASAVAQTPNAVASESLVKLRYATFDPVAAEPVVPASLQSAGADRLWIVQFNGKPTQARRDQIVEAGGQLHGYLPENSYVIRMDANSVAAVRGIAGVRWAGRYHAAYRLEPELVAEHTSQADVPARRYNIVVVDKRNDKPALAAAVRGIGGTIDDEQDGSLLFTVTLSGAQLLKAARFDEVLWIDRWTAAENDVDNARIQSGANYVETQRGYTGAGISAHIYEGIEANHPGYSGGATNVLSGGASTGHGTNTAGIVFGDGTGNPTFRGFAPDVTKFYTNYSSTSTSRYAIVDELVNNRNVSHTTASWGGGRTFFYTSVSADADDIIFDHDIVWTQSQSNAGNQDSRPQAWAKNVFSIGGFRHGNNSNPGDDSWSNSGSTGPASDGRIKPTLSAYYDNIGTTSNGGGYSSSFGGTSGATPIVAGINILAIDMFTDEVTPGLGPFGNALRNPGGTSHSNRPRFTTLKALQVANARQYSFTAASTDNRREHVGWGFPSLQDMWDSRLKMFLVDETDVLTQGNATRWDITVLPAEADLKIVMHHAEPAGNPAAAQQRVNDLTIRVTSPSGTIYWGNNGLEQGNWSVAGGGADTINPIECVFVQNPQAGVWHVDVVASLIAQDSHVETGAVDADYGLCVRGGTGQRGQPPILANFEELGAGCPGSVQRSAFCVDLNENGGTLSNELRDNEYCYRVTNTGSIAVTSFDIFTGSTGGTVVVPAHLYASLGSAPNATPVASTTITVGPAPGFYTATFASPVNMTGTFYIGLDSSAQTVYVSTLTSGAAGVGFWRDAATPNWTQSVLVSNPSWGVSCTNGSRFASPEIDNTGLPILNSSYSVTLADAVASSNVVLATGFSDTVANGIPLPVAIPGAPGCFLRVSPDTSVARTTSASGTADASFPVPNNAALIGLELFHQWAVLDSVNSLGVVMSNAARARLGN